jgi:hypothetical protein
MSKTLLPPKTRVRCVKGYPGVSVLLPLLREGTVYEIAVVVENAKTFKTLTSGLTDTGYILGPNDECKYPYVWDASRFEKV